MIKHVEKKGKKGKNTELILDFLTQQYILETAISQFYVNELIPLKE